jgi:hypothetical protein
LIFPTNFFDGRFNVHRMVYKSDHAQLAVQNQKK